MFGLLLIFIHFKVCFCVLDDILWEIKHFGNLNTITFLYFSTINSILKFQVICLIKFASCVHICNSFDFILNLDHFMEVSGKETIRINFCVEVLAKGPWETKTFIGACASTKLIDENKTFVGGSFEHTWGLNHFTHESGNTLNLMVWSSDSANDGINNGTLKSRSGNEHTKMGKIYTDTNGPDVCGFTTHVRTSQNDGFISINRDIVRYTVSDTGMSHLKTNYAFFKLWATPCCSGSCDYRGPSNQNVQFG